MNENLKRHRPDIKVLGEGRAIAFMPEDSMGVWCHIQEVSDLLDVKNKEIAKMKAQYNDMDVTHTVHIAKMNAKIEELEEVIDCESAKKRKLKRALWIARAERAHSIILLWNVYCYQNNSLYYRDFMNIKCNPFRNLPKKTAMEWSDLWESIETKLRVKAKEYK